MHQRDRGARSPAFQGRVYAAVPRADHDHPLVPIGMPLDEVMGHVRKVFPGDPEEVGIVIVARGKHDRLCPVGLAVVAAGYLDAEGAIRRSGDIDHILTGTDVQRVMLRHPAIVYEPVLPRGLLVAGDERYATDLDSLWRGEKCHRQRIALDGGYDGAAVQEHAGETGLPGRNAGRQSTGTGADYEEGGLFR